MNEIEELLSRYEAEGTLPRRVVIDVETLRQAAAELARLRAIEELLREVDARVPGLQFDYYDKSGVSLGVRIAAALEAKP